MATPAKINFKAYQGSTFLEVLRWESALKAYRNITNITKSAPVVITSAAHGIPIDWRIKLSNILGMTQLNSTETYYDVTETTTNTFTLNNVNSLSFSDYVSGGVAEFNQPVNLAGFTGRMQIRADIDSSVVISELTSANGGILIDNTLKTITLNITATATALFSFETAVYSLELISSGGQVTTFCGGIITLVKEVTR